MTFKRWKIKVKEHGTIAVFDEQFLTRRGAERWRLKYAPSNMWSTTWVSN